MLALKDSVKQLLYDGLKFVGKSEVYEAAVYLGLLEEGEVEALVEEEGGEKVTENLFSPTLVRPVALLDCTVHGRPSFTSLV